jgi:hypothetical protein
MLSKTQKKKLNEFFPSEENLNPIVSKKEVEYLATKLKKFYPVIIHKFLKIYKENFKKDNLELILRRCLVPMTYIFFERCIRSINCKKKIKSLEGMYRFGVFYKTDDFDNATMSSINFNYFLNQNFLYLLKHKKIKIIKKIKIKNDFINFDTEKRKNYLSNYHNYFGKIINLLLRKIENIVNFFFYERKILSLGLANAETALIKKAFYIFNLSRFSEIKYEKNDYNKYLRTKLFSNLGNFYNNFKEVLKNYKLSKNQLNSLYKYYILFLEDNFPKFFLEDFEKNYFKCYNFLNKFKKKIIISSDIDNSSSTLIFLVARNLNFKNIKIQHGGHYGYVNDSYVNEIETINCDEFLTYGWKRNQNNNLNNKVKFLLMPSLWLSDKKKYFKNLDLKIEKKFDFIYFPQFIKPFTNNVQGSSNFRRDVLNDYINRLLQICKNCSKNNIKMGLKLFNKKSKFFLKKTIKIINYKYQISSKFLSFYDKGISKYVLNQTNLIVFDQVGTGAMECFSYGVPVMIIHNNDYNKPNKLGEKYFRKLEESGILHKNARSFFKEYHDFKKSPETWMSEKKRKVSIKLFCKKFSLTDKNWSIRFRNYLNSKNKLYN